MNKIPLPPKASTDQTQKNHSLDSLQELRVKVAELCPDLFVHVHSPFGPGSIHWRTGQDDNGNAVSPGARVDPTSDLNACAEMREHLSEDEWYAFVDALLGKPWTSAWDWDDVTKLVSAPAADQCRAFVSAKELTSKREGLKVNA